jgi:predicted nucleic acid-binding protein
MILLDTNVISEILRPQPEIRVLNWLKAQPREEFWTCSVVIAELLSGIEGMPTGTKQGILREAVEAMVTEDFRGQVVNFDLDAARHFGTIVATRRRMGRPIGGIDAQIAACARKCGAQLATRNVRNFVDCGIQVVNPWEEN